MAVVKDKPFDELLLEQQEVDRRKSTFRYKIGDIQNWDTENLVFDIGGPRNLTSHALKQLLKKLKIPYPYFMQCSPELRDKELREAMEDANKKTEYVFKVYNAGETDERIYGIVPPQYYPALTSNFMQRIREALPSGVSLKESNVSLEEMRLRIISDNVKYVEKDNIIPGVDVWFSEVGKNPYMVQSVLFRVVCSNGLMLPEGSAPTVKIPLARFSEAQFQASLSSLGETFERQKIYADTFERLKEIELPMKVEDTEELPDVMKDAIQLVIPSKGIQRDYGQLILNQYNEDEGNNMNALVNALTRTARDIEDNTEKVMLESTAGTFLSKVNSLNQDHRDYDQVLEFSVPNFKRLFKRHA